MTLTRPKAEFLLLALDNLVRARGLEVAENAVVIAKEIRDDLLPAKPKLVEKEPAA